MAGDWSKSVRKKNLKAKFISGSTNCTLFSFADLACVLYSAKRMFKHEKVGKNRFKRPTKPHPRQNSIKNSNAMSKYIFKFYKYKVQDTQEKSILNRTLIRTFKQQNILY